MAVASTRTLLPLDRFFSIAGIHPLHGNQVVVQDLASANFCGVPILQYSYQDADRTGREEVAEMIASVETRLMEYLNFSLRPDFFANIPASYPTPNNPDLLSTSLYDNRGFIRAIWLGQGYLISGGRETKTFIMNNGIVYLDNDSDGYKETAIVTVAVADPTVSASEIAIYYPGQSGDDVWEIRPTTVVINAGIATITCRREQLVLASLMFGLNAIAVDGLDNTQFLTSVDVYRHWLDPSAEQVEFRWQQTPWSPWTSTPTPAVGYDVQGGAMSIVDGRLGWASLEAAHWDVATQQYYMDAFSVCRMPDAVQLWFKAGYPLDPRSGNMAGVWERCVTYLTLAQLDRRLCQCSSLETFTNYWAQDLAVSTTDETRQVSRKFLDNPLGTTRAAKYVWDAIQRYKIPDSDGASI